MLLIEKALIGYLALSGVIGSKGYSASVTGRNYNDPIETEGLPRVLILIVGKVFV